MKNKVGQAQRLELIGLAGDDPALTRGGPVVSLSSI